MTYDADVIIAGAGMTGATLALALESAGLKTIVVDPLPFETQVAPTFDGRSSAIAYASFRQWNTLGAGEAIAPHAQRIEQILVTDGRAPGAARLAPLPSFLRFDSAEISDASDGEPLGYMVENRHIRAGLASAITDKGLDIRASVKVVDNEAVEAGLAIMARKYPRHFLDLALEQDDAATHDVLLQYVVFGEIIYG